MSNGPMGGFMPTPPAPSQPPPVKLDTTAVSRGNFNNFLKSMNGASSLTPLAPSGMGAMMPQVAPSPTSDIDIFNTPVQFMFSGGEIDSFVDDQDSGNNFSGGDSESTVDDDPVAGFDFNEDTGSFDVVSTPTVTSDEQEQNILDAATFATGTSLPKVNFTNQSIENAFDNLNIPEKTRIELREDLQDRAKNNDLIGALDAAQKDSAEFDKTSLGEQVLNNIIQASNVNPTTFSRIAFNQGDVLGDANILSLNRIDPFKVEADPVFTPAMAGLPTVDSRFNDIRSTVAEDQARALANLVPSIDTTVSDSLQQNVKEQQEALAAQRGRALGPITFGDDLANFQERLEPFESSRVGDDFDTALDIVDRRGRDQAIQNLLDAGQRAQDIKNIQGALDRDILSQTLDQTTPTTTTSTRPEDFEEQVGARFSPERMADIERLYGVNPGQAGYGTGPIQNFKDTSRFQDGQDPTFLEGLGLPSILSALDPERRSRDLMATEVALGRPMGLAETIFGFNAPSPGPRIGLNETKKMEDFMKSGSGETIQQFNERTGRTIPEEQFVRNDSGRIVAIKDRFGRVVSGVDPNQPIGGGDDSDPIIRRVLPKEMIKEEEEEKPPNVIGGGVPVPVRDPVPVIVDSPFTTNVGDFQGTGFSTGDLNKLIAELTGIKAPTSMAKGGVAEFANGGLIKAVDDFLSSGQ